MDSEPIYIPQLRSNDLESKESMGSADCWVFPGKILVTKYVWIVGLSWHFRDRLPRDRRVRITAIKVKSHLGSWLATLGHSGCVTRSCSKTWSDTALFAIRSWFYARFQRDYRCSSYLSFSAHAPLPKRSCSVIEFTWNFQRSRPDMNEKKCRGIAISRWCRIL